MSSRKKYIHSPQTQLACLTVDAVVNDDYCSLECYLKMRMMLDGNFSINEKDNRGFSALFFAVWTQKVKVVKLLIKHGALANLANDMGFTPLFAATGWYPDVNVAACLIEKAHADVNLTTWAGVTPLHGAALKGNRDCIKLLLKHGADPLKADKDGVQPVDLAKDEATKTLLLEAMSKPIATSGSQCSHCGKRPESGLKRCGRCQSAQYCNRDCQANHWRIGGHKKSCVATAPGYVWATIETLSVAVNRGVLNCNQTSAPTVFVQSKGGVVESSRSKVDQRFIVKVQIPLNATAGAGAAMMVYNEDRSVAGMIHDDATGYSTLQKRIEEEGYMGIKAFFYAELSPKSKTGFKVYHTKCAPLQQW